MHSLVPIHGKIKYIKKLELINKRAARFITGNHLKEHGNTDKNMRTPRWPTLKDRRGKLKSIMLYKINSGLIHISRDGLASKMFR